jgi:hypothetical protein
MTQSKDEKSMNGSRLVEIAKEGIALEWLEGLTVCCG